MARTSRRRIALIAAAACALLLQKGVPAAGNRADTASLAFGTRIIDIALTLDDSAKESLKATPETGVPGQMRFKDARGADKTYEVTIHIKGGKGSVRPLEAKPAFRVKLAKGDRFFGLAQLTLNNMVQDKTMLHEALGYQVYEAAGVNVPATGYARVSVNGQPYGLYLNLEAIGSQFLMRQFGDDRGILYEGAYGVDLRAMDAEKFQLHEGTDANRAQLKAFIRALDTPGDDVFYGTPSQVDTQSFLAMMAAGTLLEDWDNYYASNNYRIYWNRSASRWFFIPTGIDQIFGSESTPVFGARGLLFQKCLASERCTKEYVAAVRGVADRVERLGLPARMDALLAVIDAAAQTDPKKTYDAAAMKKARNEMRVFIANRPNQVRAALSCLDGGRELGIGACAGAVAVNRVAEQCLEIVPRGAAMNTGGISVGSCHGATNQRWHLIARGDAFELASVRAGTCMDVMGARQDLAPVQPAVCADTDSQLFALRPTAQDTQLVARQSGKCIAIAPGNPAGSPLVQVTCAPSAAQTWRVQRSIYP